MEFIVRAVNNKQVEARSLPSCIFCLVVVLSSQVSISALAAQDSAEALPAAAVRESSKHKLWSWRHAAKTPAPLPQPSTAPQSALPETSRLNLLQRLKRVHRVNRSMVAYRFGAADPASAEELNEVLE